MSIWWNFYPAPYSELPSNIFYCVKVHWRIEGNPTSASPSDNKCEPKQCNERWFSTVLRCPWKKKNIMVQWGYCLRKLFQIAMSCELFYHRQETFIMSEWWVHLVSVVAIFFSLLSWWVSSPQRPLFSGWLWILEYDFRETSLFCLRSPLCWESHAAVSHYMCACCAISFQWGESSQRAIKEVMIFSSWIYWTTLSFQEVTIK
jgi:hypothetical protein